MAGIFISYRRKDSSGWAGRLSHELRIKLGAGQVFMDIDDIEPGMDYAKFIEESLEPIDVLLAVIGPRWLTATDEKTGRLRLPDPKDLLRMEIAAALKRPKIQVVPVLVGGATMPAAEDLPEDLQGLAGRHYHEMSDTRWEYDQDRLVKRLRRITVFEKENGESIRQNGPKQDLSMKIFSRNSIIILSCLFFLVLVSFIFNQHPGSSAGPEFILVLSISAVSTIFFAILLLIANYLNKYRKRKRRT
jgi:hypothetical protein